MALLHALLWAKYIIISWHILNTGTSVSVQKIVMPSTHVISVSVFENSILLLRLWPGYFDLDFYCDFYCSHALIFTAATGLDFYCSYTDPDFYCSRHSIEYGGVHSPNIHENPPIRSECSPTPPRRLQSVNPPHTRTHWSSFHVIPEL